MFARSHQRHSRITDNIVKTLYSGLFTTLFRQILRSWMSATSKLLWCIYPESIVIYDSFVHRTLVVMQRIDSDLSAFPRIGTPPKVKREIDIKQAANYYVTYQALVRRLQRVHNKTLAHLRRHNHED